MIYIINDSDDPFFNHASEEYLMDNFEEEIFMLWINRPSILIGRNQNTLSEINSDYVKEKEIKVVRRLSGGGTVFNDYGNMNYSFITYKIQDTKNAKNSFEKFAIPVINALESLGVHATFSGRNDITIEDKKFSGNAQFSRKDKLLHHGTLLFDCDMDKLSLALKSKPIKFKDKSVKSVGSRVTNILPHLDENMSLLDFKNYLKDYVIKTHEIKTIYEFNNKDIEEIEKISTSRFKSWEWNYGKSPKYTYENAVKYPCGVVEYNMNIEEGVIRNISIYGDFFGNADIRDIEPKLIGVRHTFEDLELALNEIIIDNYIKGLSNKEFIEGLLDIYSYRGDDIDAVKETKVD